MEIIKEKTRPFFKTEIPIDWEVKNLEDLVYPERPISYGIVQTGVSIANGVPCIRVTDIVEGEIAKSDLITTSTKISQSYKRTILRKGDLVMALRGKIGSIAKIYNDLVGANLTRGVALISLKNDYYNNYIKQYISSSLSKGIFERRLNGSALQELSIGIVRKTPIPLPPTYIEQKAIAKVLCLMDEAIKTNNRLIDEKELLKKWLTQNLLTGKKKLRGFNGEWKEFHLGDMFAERNERNTDELPLLSIGQNGVYPQGESIKKDTSNADKSKYKKICIGDIGYNTMRMWQGRSALSTLEGIVSPAYTILKPRKNADALFFSYLFKTPKMVNLFWRNSQGLVGDTLNCKYKDFSIVKATLPLKDEQTAIAKILQAADKELDLLKAKTDKLKEQKKGMMQVLLTGKKRLKI
jgi:type I restriction enzyme S subunit